MDELPKSFSKLYNLQILNLTFCLRLKELPNDFCKLVNLMELKLEGCHSLAFMPSGMRKLTNIYKLSTFVVGDKNSGLKLHSALEDLKALEKLRGCIRIEIHCWKTGPFVKDGTVREGAYMRDKEHLSEITFDCKHEARSQGPNNYEEKLLGYLQPHANLKELVILWYRGVRMPTWAEENNLATFLPNLVRLHLNSCTELLCLPSLENLYHLKYLTLACFPNVEYVESQPSTNSESMRFSPCLEELTLKFLPKLEVWYRGKGINSMNEPHQSSLFLSQLKILTVWDCPELTSLPDCSNIETVVLYQFNERLQVVTKSTSCPKLKEVTIDNLAWLQSSLPLGSFQSLASLILNFDKKIESLNDFEQFFRACSSSLRKLGIYDCPKLESLSGGLSYLAALESISLNFLPGLNFADGVGDGMSWGSLCHTLFYLVVYDCKKMESISKGMRKLTSLRSLNVMDCSKEVCERCQNPNGEDWLNIQHIPNIHTSYRAFRGGRVLSPSVFPARWRRFVHGETSRFVLT